MNKNCYTLDSTLSEVLSEECARQFFEQIAPGMLDSPVMSYMNGASISQLMENMTDKSEMFQTLVDIANGKEVSITMEDPKKALPRLNDSEEFLYNIDDVDGKMYMLDHRFSGCLVVRFTKDINESVYGSVTYEGKELPRGLIKHLDSAGGIQMFGIPVREICTEYDKEYCFHVEGFVDTDGNQMKPQDIKVKTLARPEVNPAYAEHDAVALEAAREGIVLLKNEGDVLPIPKDSKLEVVGAETFRLGAVGAGKINPRYYMNLNRAIEEHSEFCKAEEADMGIFVVSRASGENFDNAPLPGEYYLTKDEERKIQEMTSRCKRVIAVINSGYPMDLRWVETYQIPAVIWCGFPGMLGGQALVEILDGRVNPSGKLPDTWSLDYYDIPASRNFYVPKEGEEPLSADAPVYIDTCYEEDIYVGYRYFETFQKKVAYPFGHGLSYTKFFMAGDYVNEKISVDVKNIGARDGKEVVQVYVKIPDGKLEQPSLRLVGFAKTKLLKPGESQTLEIPVQENKLTSFDTERACWLLEAGNYQFYVGDAVNQLAVVGEWEVKTERITGKSENLMKLPIEMEVLSKKKGNFPKGEKSGIRKDTNGPTPKSERKHYVEEAKASAFVSDLSVRELARLSVCASHGWGVHETGEAGRIYRLEEHDIPRFAVADGNNGVNVNKPNIGMPCSNTLCATWNTELAYEVGHIIAEEAKENDIAMILAPAMNIHRNPLNGRHPEYFSEDPYLAGIMAGHQSKGLEEHGVSSCIKHVIANNCESSRKRNHSFITERALREIYLKVFEVALSVHQADSLMTSYNACNGCFCAEDEELLQGIFRREFGFKGFVMTDWNSYDTIDVAKAVGAGNCWMTPGSTDDTYVQPIIDGVANGIIDESRLRSNVQSMINVVMRGE